VSFTVSIPVYEGPFDLLLHLILKEEVELYEVSISRIVDEYLKELDRLPDLDLEVATEFLLIASILVELKTRRLLPGKEDLDLDEDFAALEERDLLLARLLECKTFKDAAVVLRGLSVEARRSKPRRSGPEESFLKITPDIFEGVELQDLCHAFARSLEPRKIESVDISHIAPIRASVTDAVAELTERLPIEGKTTFRHLTHHLEDRIEVIVRFLAVLELYKQGVVELDQLGSCGDIHLRWAPSSDTVNIDFVGIYEG